VAAFVENRNGFDVYDQGMAGELRTGVDPNGATHDIELNIGLNYLTGELWFDPNPAFRIDPVDPDRTDAVSVFLHELGHALSFNGWRNDFDGSLPGTFQSTFDELTYNDGSYSYFFGPEMTAFYGGDAPLTLGNAKHLGNWDPDPGSDLIPELMNGVVFYRGVRYDILQPSFLVTKDTGVSVLIPPCDDVDFNNDGIFPDGQDLADFVEVFGAGPCPSASPLGCNDIDFNNDGVFPDFGDVVAFVVSFGGGTCPS
jgi:hypothetical protein